MSNPFMRFICTICGPKEKPCEHWVEEETIRVLKGIREVLEAILDERKFLRQAVLEIIHLLNRQVGFTIQQVQGEQSMAITGIVAGATGQFTATPTPAGSKIPDGTVPVWTSSDPANAPAVASADGLSCSVAVPAGATITTFTLSVQNQDGTFPTSVSVPVTPAVIAQTGFDINQTS